MSFDDALSTMNPSFYSMLPSGNGIGKKYGYDTIIETNGVIVSPTFG